MRAFIGSAGIGLSDYTFFTHANFNPSGNAPTNLVLLNRYVNLNFGPSRQISITLDHNYHKGRILMAKGTSGNTWMMLPATNFDMVDGGGDCRFWAPYISFNNGIGWTKCTPPMDFATGATGFGSNAVKIWHAGCIDNGSGGRRWMIGVKWQKTATDSTVTSGIQVFTSNDDGATWTGTPTSSRYLLMGTGKYTANVLQLTSQSAVRGTEYYTRDGSTFTLPYNLDISGNPVNTSNTTDFAPMGSTPTSSQMIQMFIANDIATGQVRDLTQAKRKWGNPQQDIDSTGTMQGLSGYEYLNCGNGVWIRVKRQVNGTDPFEVDYSVDNMATWTVDSTNQFRFSHSGTSQCGYWAYPTYWA